MRIQRTITVDRPLPVVFDYLADFTTTNEWDPGTERTTLVSGDGGVGSEYHNVSVFAGRRTELTYVVDEVVPQRRIALTGRNKTVTAHDTMEFSGGESTTTVVYTADFEFHGIARYVAWALAPAFKKLGDEAEQGMHEALNRL
jgi:uncharacterized protein YndB with AHSA1/START domain